MSQRPPLLPADQPRRQRRSAFAMLAATAALLSVTLIGGVVTLVYRPDAVGLAARDDASATAAVLGATREVLETQIDGLALTFDANEAQAVANASTAQAIESQQAQLAAEGTQAALDAEATQTRIAANNAQQATNAALAFEGTRAAFDRMATQVEIEYQGTQAALSREATAVALGFATLAPSGQDILSQTPPPTLTAIPLFTDGSAATLSGAVWDYQQVDDWLLNPEGRLVARRSGAWLLTRDSFQDYALTVHLRPVTGPGLAADYYVLLGIPADGPGLALRLSYDGERLTAAALVRATRAQVLNVVDVFAGQLSVIETTPVDAPPAERLDIRADRRGSRLTVVVNGQMVFDTSLDSATPNGALGLQIPVGAQIEHVVLLP